MILLCGCTTSAKVNKTKNQNLFDKTNFSNYQNIMIVAHPDDESIWEVSIYYKIIILLYV